MAHAGGRGELETRGARVSQSFICFNGRAIVLSVIVSLARGAYSTVPTLYGERRGWLAILPGELQLAVNHPLSARSLAHRRGHVLRVSRRRRLGHDLNGASSGYDDRPELQILRREGSSGAVRGAGRC